MTTNVKVFQNNTYAGEDFRVEGLELTCLPNTTSSISRSWVYPIAIVSVDFFSLAVHVEDVINVNVAENSIISTTSVNASAGNTSLTLNSMINMYGVRAKKGFNAKITDGTNENDLGEIISANTSTNTITFANPLLNNFEAGSNLEITIQSVRNFKIGSEGYHEMFKHMINGYVVPPTIPVTLYYTNNTPDKKTFTITLHYFY
jgi:hypothetical protein